MVFGRGRTPLQIVLWGQSPPADGRAYVLAVPGRKVPVQRFDLPRGVSGRTRRAIALRSLADRIGSMAGSLDLIPLGPDADWEAALICDRVASDIGQSAAAGAGKTCRAVLPDYLTLPVRNGEITVIERDGTMPHCGGR